MVVNNPLIRPAISWGKRGIGGVPLDFHERFSLVNLPDLGSVQLHLRRLKQRSNLREVEITLAIHETFLSQCKYIQ